MRSSALGLTAAILAAATAPSLAATAEEWKSRSIYQLITDRFAPPSDTAPARTNPLPAECDPILQTWCGGTWLSIIDKLDYIQGMGFDAIWISPTGQNIDIHTPYNYAYHGYWVNDPMTVNPRFGSSDDLKALSKALHDRDMLLMVDVAVNNVPSLNVHDSLDPVALAADNSRWTQPEYFHPHCWIDYGNTTSVEQCWLGDDNLPLMDVNTEHPDVISQLQAWIPEYVKEYGIDGLRIDAAKHVRGDFWPGFCGASGVFCIGEVYGDDMQFAADWQRENWMDAILGFPLYYGIVAGFGTPMGNMSHFIDISRQVLSNFPHPEYLGNFIENHDLPRFRNSTVDPQLAYNAMVVQFVFEGIPVIYFGQEQDISFGLSDPYNRNALWPYNYTNTTTYQRMGRLNEVRHSLIANNTMFNGSTFMNARSEIVASSDYDVAIRKGPLLAVLTNRGSPNVNATFGVRNSGWPSASVVVDILSCRQMPVGSEDSITVSYAQPGYGGMPYVFLSLADAQSIGVCGLGKSVNAADAPPTTSRNTNNVSGALALAPATKGALALTTLLAALAVLT